MILVYGQGDDPPIEHLVAALHRAGASFQLLDIARLHQSHLDIQVGPQGLAGELVLDGVCTALADIRAVYARPLEPAVDSLPEPAQKQALQLHRHLVEWLDVAPACVVSRPAAMQANASKPLQAQWIGEAGFLVPPTLVTSDAAEVRAFHKIHGRVVFKSVSGIRSIVTELDDTWLSRMHRLAQLPTQFQAHVPGVDVRVHVVGQQALAAEITSTATDYRYAHRSGAAAQVVATTLPPTVAARCIAMSHAMGLPLSGIDLRLRPDGEYVCFEVNPMPAFSYFEVESGLPIAAALAELLMGA
ncbi:RimK family alpha-L-glutamate ligase [Rhodoferax sp. WC2427]|uniref:ATP-grasp domain-containing protein n=1 Tax=Rhodoferax sp. WC2427 TaxID=3234144 RepID=UPI003467D24D